MQRRDFLAAGALAALPFAPAAVAAPRFVASPVVLTVTGGIAHTNRGPLDPALDQLMVRQKVAFERAFAFDYASLAGLPARSIEPVLEYDGRPHELRGPKILDVLEKVGAGLGETTHVTLRAVDGYSVELDVATLRQHDYLLATQLDDMPIPLGGLGPLWAVFDPARVPELAAAPLKQRFARCPWGLYHIDVYNL